MLNGRQYNVAGLNVAVEGPQNAFSAKTDPAVFFYLFYQHKRPLYLILLLKKVDKQVISFENISAYEKLIYFTIIK